MDNLWAGIQVGLVLCFLLGPIFFAIIQTAIEQGFRAGITLAAGVWTGDLLYIVAVLFGLTYVQQVLAEARFAFALGLIGSGLLITFGAVAMFARPNMRMRPRKSPIRSSSLFALFMKGFILNTFNPFNLLFWLGVLSTVLLNSKPTGSQANYFIAGFILTVAATDVIKVLLAKRIRRWMRPRHLLWFRRLSGLALVVFGLALFIRVLTMG